MSIDRANNVHFVNVKELTGEELFIRTGDYLSNIHVAPVNDVIMSMTGQDNKSAWKTWNSFSEAIKRYIQEDLLDENNEGMYLKKIKTTIQV